MAVGCLEKFTGERLIVLNPYPACENVQHQTSYRKANIHLKTFENENKGKKNKNIRQNA